MMYKYFTVFFVTLFVLSAAMPALAQQDPFGSVDLVYLDSVEVGAGEDIVIRCFVKNDETLGSMSVPITYDTELLTLKSISFADSRAEYLATKIVNPANIAEIDGHFVVALIQVFEDPMPVGEGLLFTTIFKVADSATPGTVSIIDTLFYPPGGELLLVEATTSGSIRPAFKAGKVVVGAPNQQPVFGALPDMSVMEGDTVSLGITVADSDEDIVAIAATSKPTGAVFVDNGDGTAQFTWVPDFVGPNSADGSPFRVGFWASDGDLSAETELFIQVVNRNRAPVINDPGEQAVEAGLSLSFTITAIDPDFEEINWSWSGFPEGAEFDANNPGTFQWNSKLTDTGSFIMQFIATDPLGLSDTVDLAVSINAITLYTLELDSVAAFPNENVDFDISLDNKFTVSSFNLLFNYDPSALSLLSLTNTGTRTESFEYFTVEPNADGVAGNVRVLGIADNGGGTEPLSAGDGTIAVARFHTSGNLAYAGFRLPVIFRFLDVPTNDDNTLTDSVGTRIEQEDIVYVNGSIKIQDMDQILIGDINLNGLAAEIGDVIYFTNHFINPILYSFNALQYANSDVNQDNIAATVSDLVTLINWLVNGTPVGKSMDGTEMPEVTITTEWQEGKAVIGYESLAEIGGAYLVIATDLVIEESMIHSLVDNMTLDWRQDDSEIKLLLYSLTGECMPAGAAELITIEGLESFEIKNVDVGSADGRYVRVALTEDVVNLPSSFSLEQNYPNPFNPDTRIEFSLHQPAQVELIVFNVLGQRVKSLAGSEYPAGTHTVVWNGTDHYGQPVASGIYLYRLQAGTHSSTRKMLLMK